MSLRVTLGRSVSASSGPGERELPLPEGQSLTLQEVTGCLGLQLLDAEGALLVFVNARLCSTAELSDLKLRDGDHLTLHRMLSGG